MHFASQIHLFSILNIFSITNRKQQKKRKKVIRTIFPDTQFLFVQWSNIDSAKPELLIACNEPDWILSFQNIGIFIKIKNGFSSLTVNVTPLYENKLFWEQFKSMETTWKMESTSV